MKFFIYILILFCLFACNKSEKVNTFLDCPEIAENYKLYDGEEIGCQFHFQLTEYKNDQYIELVAHCADLSRAFVFNTNCVDICETDPYGENSECSKYLNGRTEIEIVLISK